MRTICSLGSFRVLVIAIFTMAITSTSSFSQENAKKHYTQAEVKAMNQRLQELSGTYQLQVLGRQNPLKPVDLSKIIDEHRKESETTYVQLGTQLRLQVLSKREISAAGFKAVPEVGYVTSFNK